MKRTKIETELTAARASGQLSKTGRAAGRALIGLAALVAVGGLVGLAGPAAAQSTNLLDGNPKNGLSSRAFLRNALTLNPSALGVMLAQPLDNALLQHPLIRYQLNDVSARAVMAEIIKCALRPDTELTHVTSYPTYRWRGELGLCHGSTEAGNWNAGPPTTACQELVTACVMARVNALGKSVPLSMRGAPAELFPVSAAIGAEPFLRERVGNEDPAEGRWIESFSAPICMPGQECKWAPAYVGRCEGGLIKLAFKDASVCATTPIRVCAGIHGCYGPGSPVGYPSTVSYSKFLAGQEGACATGGPFAPIQFTCPVEAQFGGYYSVMTRPPIVGRVKPVSPAVLKLSGTGVYPITEEQVFSFREGAFYGNLFTPAALSIHCQVSPSNPSALLCGPAGGAQTPYPCANGSSCQPAPLYAANWNLHACFAMIDDAGSALVAPYLNDRVCAQNGAQCFLYPPQHCSARCQWSAALGAYTNCRGIPDASGVAPAYRPITTYLNAACDLLGSPDTCGRLNAQLP